MVDINVNLGAVNVTSAKDKFADVIGKVIAQKTTAPPLPPPPPPKKNDDDPKAPQSTPPLVYAISGSPPPGATPGALPPYVYSLPGSPSPIPTSPPPKPISNAPANSSSSSSASTKIAAKEKSGGSGTAVVVSVAVVFCLMVVAIAVFVVRRRKAKDMAHAKSLSPTGRARGHTDLSTRYGGTANLMDDATGNYSHMPNTGALAVLRHQTSTTLADHPEIMAVRIPLEKIEFCELLSRGGFGEVHRGTYKGQDVAIKRLLPERRKDLRQIDAFLAEAKLMGTLEHERVVQFIGVAWDSLSELCVVSEYMEAGDLRSVLSRWEKDEHREHGFDHDKIKIALHVAHAMTYLHSMQPVILHRDLKSKNILLSHDLDAKLTDFGVSRERSDATMTAGVGSSLWMAPEVMMGERYDDKADVFSFGVVLSELDTHRLPYSHAAEPGTGRKIPDTAVLQMVALGKIEVEFTAEADRDMVALGRDCVALDPKNRPTAGEALHRVHQLWRSCAVSL